MNIKRKCQVVMLPTQSKAVRLNQLVIGAGNFLFRSRQSNDIGSLTAYELYITSDEDIKEYDWVYSEGLQYVFQTLAFPLSAKDAKKIIATTDTSLISINEQYFDVNKSRKSAVLEQKTLHQPSQEFIRQYIEEYNKGRVISEVEVEYEEDLIKVYDNPGGHPGGHWEPNPINNGIKLKVNPDNIININPIKDSWSREEVIEFGLKCVNLGMDLKNNPSSFLNGLSGKDYYYKLIEENL